MATDNFLTTGGDGYAALAAAPSLATTDIGEQEILESYIVDDPGGTVEIADPPEESRVIRLSE